MTRDQMVEWCRKMRVPMDGDDAIDRLYYVVAVAIKQEREACVRDIETEAETWAADSPARLSLEFAKTAIKNRGMQ
jgi:hypothetical protein